MTVEDKRSVAAANEDKFPAGLRVLAVDDDPICLKVLETLLRKCQYHVTTTNQSITALKMLRENRDKYDLVISDVNMPDMDGFKLLELVGLEMDLPVIMLSAHGDKELVYKGVSHGAVDYLLKPVRIEELKNIWQHVIRKKKLSPKDQNRSLNQDRHQDGTGEVGQGLASTGSSDQNGKLNRKRKDQDGEEEEEGEDNGHENEEPGTQKKPRVVWSVELHRKFVAAVNQLGLDKAVPKKILDLMNVEGLTRENVASHLQKYRLYLKRISTAASQQANMVAALGAKDASYLRMGSLDGFGDFRTLNGPGRISSTSLSSYPPSGMLGRLNSPAGLTLHGITSSGLIQPGHSQTLSNSVNALGKIQPTLLPANQGTNLFQGNPLILENKQLQITSNTHTGQFNRNDDATGYPLGNSFPDARVTINGTNNSISTASSNPLMLQTNLQQSMSRGTFATQSSISVPPMNQESFDIGVHGSSNYLDHSRFNENWQDSTQLSKFSPNSLPVGEPFSCNPLPTNSMRDNASTGSHVGNSAIDFSSCSALATPLENSRVDMQGQAGLMDNVIQNINYSSTRRWDEHGQGYNPGLNRSFSSIHSLVSMGPRKTYDTSLLGQLNNGASSMSLDPKLRSNEEGVMEQQNSHFIQNNFESLDNVMDAMIKREQSETVLMDGEFGFDAYSLGSCM